MACGARDGPDGALPRRALLIALLVISAALAGCHGTGDVTPAKTGPDDAERPATTPPAKGPTPVIIATPLPPLQTDVVAEDGLATLHIHVDGDAALIASHAITWGDGTNLRIRAGAPPLRYTHEYAQPPDWRAPAIEYTATITLYGEHGNTRDFTVPIRIEPPANMPPTPGLVPAPAAAEVPSRVTFHVTAGDTDGRITSWRFDPGDGTFPSDDTGPPPATFRHAYDRIGTYTARLTVTDDAGTKRTDEAQVRVLPPQDRMIWSVSSTNATAIQSDANGEVLATHQVLGPCAFEDRCPHLVDATAAGDALAILIAEHNATRLIVLDGSAGHIRHQQRLAPAGERLAVDPDGRFWVTHRDGTISWTHGDTEPRQVTVPATDADIRIAFSATTTWVLVSDTTARLYQIDPVAARASLLPLPIPVAAHQLAVNAKHDLAVVVDRAANAWVVAPNLYGPRLVRIAAFEDGGEPIALTCPDGHSRCWAALDGDRGHLVPIDVAATAASTTATTATTFPDDIHPGGLFATTKHLVVPTIGAGNATHLVDPTNGNLIGTVAPPHGTTPHTLVAHPQHPRLAYLGDTAGWGILDLEAQHIVHVARSPAGDLGPYLVTLPRTR